MRNEFEDEFACFVAAVATRIWLAVVAVLGTAGGYGVYHLAARAYRTIA